MRFCQLYLNSLLMGGSFTSNKDVEGELRGKLAVIASEQQERLARRRAEEMNLPYINLTIFPVDPDVLERVPKSLAQKAQAVLFYRKGQDVRVGVVNPILEEVKEVVGAVKEMFNVEPQIHVMSHRSLQATLARYRREKAEARGPEGELHMTRENVEGFDQDLDDMEQMGEHLASLPPTQILTLVVAGAVKDGASDIHIEPLEKSARLRYRIDGVLLDVTHVPRTVWRLLLSRVKVLAKMKLNVREVPQDGSFVVRVGEATYDIRVSVLPGGEGESIVMRLLNREVKAVRMTELGMKARDYEVMSVELKKSNGMILVTGPTGSGKTTSLASFLQEVNSSDVKIITLENPIEYHIPGVQQTQIDHAAGYTFAVGLRAILRQDPDVVMVGEIRDAETSETALHAALTGHLVFSTLHTNDAPGAVPRLVDMGMKPYVIAPAVNVIIAQRLVRVVCRECGEKYKPDANLLEHINDVMAGVSQDFFNPAVLKESDLMFYRAKGCDKCRDTGYRGRKGVFEIMPVQGEVEDLIAKGADSRAVMEAAMKAGMTSIVQDAYLKVIEGVTTVEEVERVTEE